MKIVILYLGKRGAGPMYSYEVTKALLQKNIKILAFISAESENIYLWKELASNYINLNLVIVNTYKNVRQFIINTFKISNYIEIIRKIKDYSPKYIYTPMVHPWHNIIISLLPSRIIKIKTIHDVKVHIGEQNLFSNFLSWIDIKLSNILIVLSEHSKEQLIKRIGVKKNIIVIPHANFGIYKQFDYNKINKQSINNRIGFIGRINKYKGLNILLSSFKDIIKENPNLRLLIAGNGNCAEYEKDFKELNKSLDLDIRWIADDEMASVISKVDIIILPYIEASQSGIIPLAYSLGKPVIATMVGGIPEQVPHNTGLLISPNEPLALTNAVLELYKNPNKILEMGENAAKYAFENLTWEASANIFLKHIN